MLAVNMIYNFQTVDYCYLLALGLLYSYFSY